MKIDKRKLIRRILEDFGKSELALVRKALGSQTLKAAMRLIIDESEQRADLFVPHYWAIWYHDGRGSISPVNARKLVFFDDPSTDPRIKGGRPVTKSQVRRLTREQYREGLRKNRERPKGSRPFMWVVDSVGPSVANPFFDDLAVGSPQRMDVVASREFERELLAWIDSDPATKSETRVADLGFGL